MRTGRWVGLGGVVLLGGCGGSVPSAGPARVQEVLTQPLPALRSAEPHVQVLEVSYPPGGASKSHRHPCAVVAYITEGELRSAVGDGPARVYHTGESFYEAPNALHRISANASRERPVRFTATFICDTTVALSVPAR